MYNARGTIGACLDSLFTSSYRDIEVIVVNDNSTDGCEKIVENYDCTLVNVNTGRNLGAGATRNIGARKARGALLYFVDSDIIQTKDTLQNIARAFKEDAGLDALAGIYSKHPTNSGFGADYMALKTFYFVDRGPGRKEISFVQSGCFAIKKSVFDETGGFSGKRVGEEYEYGHRLSRTHKIIMDTSVIVLHHHPDVLTRLVEITRRSYHWFPMFLERRRFETDGGTGSRQEGLSALLVFSSFLSLLLAFGLAGFSARQAACALAVSALLLWAVSVGVNHGLYRFFARERSWSFAVLAILTDDLLYVGVGSGAAAAFVVFCGKSLKGRDKESE